MWRVCSWIWSFISWCATVPERNGCAAGQASQGAGRPHRIWWQRAPRSAAGFGSAQKRVAKMLLVQDTSSDGSKTRKPASVWLTTADSFWRSLSRMRICSSRRRNRRSSSSSIGCGEGRGRSATRSSSDRPPVAPGVGAGQAVGHHLYLIHRVGIECVQVVAVDVDLGEDRLALADEHDELGAGGGGAGQVVGRLADVRDVDVALLGDGQAADALADRYEDMVRGRAHERSESQHVVREQLVDPGPVKVLVGGVQLLDGPPEHLFQGGARRHHPLERLADLAAAPFR